MRPIRPLSPWLAGGTVFLVLATLYAAFPYTLGYSQARATMLGLLWNQWQHLDQGEWQHGIFVPFLSLFLAYRVREPLSRAPARLCGAGWIVLGAGLFLYWLGYAADVIYLGYLSFMAVAAALILLFRGRASFRLLLFPWAFLVFMFPLPALDNLVAFPLRMIMSQGAHLLLAIIGIDNLRIGTAVVSAPDFTRGLAQGARFAIDVADPCSGIRSLFALLMISALYGQFALEGAGRRLALFVVAFPLAVAGNMVRIVLLTLATLWWGSAFAIGAEEHPTWFHMAAGYAVFAVALGGMMLCGKILMRRGAPNALASTPASPAPGTAAEPERPPILASAIALAATALALGLCVAVVPLAGSTVAGVTMTLPYRLGNWWGFDQPVSIAEKTILPSDTQIVRKSYESASGDNVLCSIVLSGAEKRSIHRPEICLPSQGWTVRNGAVIDVPLRDGRTLQVMNLTVTRSIRTGGDRQVELPAYYMYWFVGDHETTPYHWKRIWLTSWDRLVHHRNHRWAYVIVTSPITEGLRPGGKTPAETLAMLKAFIGDVVPSFQQDEAPGSASSP